MKKFTILLVGTPNSGKSTIFNLLSGANRKVSNYAGVTVDTGICELKSNKNYPNEHLSIVDLPGIYNLNPTSIDEAITTGTILGENLQIPHYDLIALVLDINKLENTLFLILNLQKVTQKKIVLIVNKADSAKLYDYIDWQQLKIELKVNIVVTSALNDSSEKLDGFLRDELASLSDASFTNNSLNVLQKSIELFPFTVAKNKMNLVDDQTLIYKEIEELQRASRSLLRKVTIKDRAKNLSASLKIDHYLTHPVWGTIFFILVFYLIFHSIYTLAVPVMDFLDNGVTTLSGVLDGYLPESTFKSLLLDGVIAGVGGVIVFLPQIMILFFLLNVLEQTGYLSRAAFLTDKLFSVFGLSGKAFVPYLSGFACSIPAIMATRTIADKKERLATLITIPLITCSARLPVYVLLIGTFIPEKTYWGFFNSQAMMFFFLYFLGSFMALIIAKLFRLSYFKGKSQSFFIEMPFYQMPSLKTAFKQSFNKGKVFLKNAGTIIFTLSLIIWALSSYPKIDSSEKVGLSNEQVAALQLEKSVLGRVGKVLEPALAPLGYDWKMGVGLLVAFGARELFVSALGTIYALGDVDENSRTLQERLLGDPHFSMSTAVSLLIFFVFACQCTSTLGVVRRETDSIKIPLLMFTYMTSLAYLAAYLAKVLLA